MRSFTIISAFVANRGARTKTGACRTRLIVTQQDCRRGKLQSITESSNKNAAHYDGNQVTSYSIIRARTDSRTVIFSLQNHPNLHTISTRKSHLQSLGSLATISTNHARPTLGFKGRFFAS